MTLLIAAALKDELKEFVSLLQIDCTMHLKPALLHRGTYQNRDIRLLVTGMGEARMQSAMEQTLTQLKPQAALLVGYCGGTSPLVGLGSLILANGVVNEETGERLTSSAALLDPAKKFCEMKHLSHQVGGMVTVRNVVSGPHEKAALGARHQALGLDMEAFAFARAAANHEVPWLVAKSVLDAVDVKLPNLQDCVYPTGEPRVMEFMGHLFSSPKEFWHLPQLQYMASQARRAATDFATAWVEAS